MGITPQDLKKILKTNPPEKFSGGFVASHFSKGSTKRLTSRQHAAMWRDPSRTFAWAK